MSSSNLRKPEINVDKMVLQLNRVTNGSWSASNKGIMPNMNNIGGRYLITNLNQKHAQSLKSTKKQIDNSLPWSYQPKNSKLHHQNHPNIRTLSPTKKSQSNRSRASSPLAPKARQLSPVKSPKKVQRFDAVFDLKYDHQQKVYEAFVDLLCELGQEKCEIVSNAAALDAQERLLLESYNGIDNFFERNSKNSENLSDYESDDNRKHRQLDDDDTEGTEVSDCSNYDDGSFGYENQSR